MSRETLATTGLMQPGSLIRWTYRLKLPEPRRQRQDGALATPRASRSRAIFPESRICHPRLDRPCAVHPPRGGPLHPIHHPVGFTALLLGGIGVGNAIRSYMAKKREIIATFKTLGASSRLVFSPSISSRRSCSPASASPSASVLGALTPGSASATYGEALPIALAVEPHPLSLLRRQLAGLLTMLLFVLRPLGRAASVSPATLMRSHLSDEQEPSPLALRRGRGDADLRSSRSRSPRPRSAPSPPRSRPASSPAFSYCYGFGLFCAELTRHASGAPAAAFGARAHEHRRSPARSLHRGLARARPWPPCRHRADRALAHGRVTRTSIRPTLPPIISSTSTPRTSPPSAIRRNRLSPTPSCRRADAARPHRRDQRRSGGEGAGSTRQPLGAGERPRLTYTDVAARGLDHR